MRLDQNQPSSQNTGSSGTGFASWHSSYTSTQGDVRRIWPDAVAFREAIQSPTTALNTNTDSDLRHASVALDRMGMPLAYSGRFAVVFRLTTPTGDRWALRCFTSPGEDGRGAARTARYRIITEHTARMDNTFVPFRYIAQGIKVGSEWYPAIAMRWATGDPLGRWVEKHLQDPPALRRLCSSLSGLLQRLEEAGIAHGDWQHDNLIIADDGARVTLVDYDGMYVPEFAGLPCPELGHPNYQHPDRTTAHFGPGLDRFSCLVIETALLALAHDPSLWARYADGESLVFKKHDLADPDTSPAFAAVREVALQSGDQELMDSLARLIDSCYAGADSTLLPTVAPGPAPTSLYTEEALRQAAAQQRVERVTPAPPLPSPASGQKWYQVPETATALAAGRTNAARRAPRRIISNRQVASEFLDKLELDATRKEETAHLWRWRGGAIAVNTFLLAMLYHWQFQHGYPPWYFLWVLNFAGLGYGKWPRKKIYEELVTELAKMENLIADRNQRMKAKGGAAIHGTLAEYVAERLKQTSINQIITVTSVQPSTMRTLRDNGIDNLLDFKQRYATSGYAMAPVSRAQLQTVDLWIGELEKTFVEEFNKPGEVDRLRHELGEFERHAAALRRERDQFPDTSFGAYVRKLVGMSNAETETPPSSSSGTTGGTPGVKPSPP